MIEINKQLTTPFSMLVAASSKSGKTQLIRDLLVNHYRMFDKPLEQIVWLYHKSARDDNLMNHLKTNLNIPITFVEGFPADAVAAGSLFDCSPDALKCIVLDDVVTSALKSSSFLNLFTIMSAHNNLVVIAILQNLHADTPSQRQVMNNVIRNTSYVVLFPDRRQMSACKQMARIYFQSEENILVQPFQFLIDMKEKHNYMVIDFVDQDIPVKFNSLRPSDEKYVLLPSSIKTIKI